MRQTIFLVLTSAIAIDGGICRAGSLVEVSELEAKNFLHRGKARLATAEDGAPVDDEPEALDLSKMSKAKLLDFCEASQITADDGMTKAEILAAIEAITEGAE
jgi:hypothetical protein